MLQAGVDCMFLPSIIKIFTQGRHLLISEVAVEAII